MKNILKNLKNNNGEVNMQKMIIISVFFVVGAILIGIVIAAVNGNYGDGLRGIINDIMH